MPPFSKPKNKGFSLVEILLTLGVIALLAVAAFVIYPQVRLSQQVNAEVHNLAAIHSGLNSLYSTVNHNYSSLTLDVARKAGIFPKTMVNGNTVTNAWGGSIVLGPSVNPYSGISANHTYVIRYRKVPADACAAFVTRAASYYVAIGVGTESRSDGSYAKIVHVLTDAGSTGYNKGPTSGVQIESLLNECNSRDESEIMFIAP